MKPLSKDWTAEDRLRVVAAWLPGLQEDIYAGNYSAPGRINITSIQHLLREPASVLEDYRAMMEKAVAEHEKSR